MPRLTDHKQRNEWQGARTNRDRWPEPASVDKEWTPGRRKVAVQAVDVFGNDTVAIVQVTI